VFEEDDEIQVEFSVKGGVKPGHWGGAAFVSIGFLMAGLVGWRFRRLRGFLFAFALVVLSLAVSGCGGSSSSSSSKGFTVSVSPSSVTVSAGTSGIPTGSYTLQITGQDSSNSSLTASTTLTLIVN
jgi:hypothetical protein